MITIDGSMGEGGGQVLRTSLALSLVTGKPFLIENIRANRKKGGLMRQHLTCVYAAAEVGSARVEGAEIGSKTLTFIPGEVRPGDYSFAVGSAGSATLVFQTVLPALMIASEQSHLTFEGGTHNTWSPPFDFLVKTFLPCLGRIGPKVDCHLDQYGFYPAGGGKFTADVSPAGELSRIELCNRGEILSMKARVLISQIPDHVAERELEIVKSRTKWPNDCLEHVPIRNSKGPGNVLFLEMESEHITEVVTGFGQPGVRAEKVAEEAVREIMLYLSAKVPVGLHLADQLLIPMAMAGGGRFTTLPPSEHTLTNIEVVGKFLDVDIVCTPTHDNVWEVSISKVDEEDNSAPA